MRFHKQIIAPFYCIWTATWWLTLCEKALNKTVVENKGTGASLLLPGGPLLPRGPSGALCPSPPSPQTGN